MKRLLGVIPLLAGGLAIVLAIGCKEEETNNSPPVVARVTVDPEQDTLCIIPGQISATAVTVTVEDQYGRGRGGVLVDISLHDSVYSRLEYADSTRRDTTNVQGRIGLIYFTENYLGSNWIYARVGTVGDTAVMVTVASEDPLPNVTVHLSRHLVHLSETDTIAVTIALTSPSGNGIAGAIPDVQVTGGVLDPFPTTDTLGFTRSVWHFTEVATDLITACLMFERPCLHGTLCRTDSVQVLP